MLGFVYALVTVLAWGTWLAPSQHIVFKNQQIKTFYVAAANLVLAAGMLLLVEQLGAGRGFTLSQLAVVLNGVVGVFGSKIHRLAPAPPR